MSPPLFMYTGTNRLIYIVLYAFMPFLAGIKATRERDAVLCRTAGPGAAVMLRSALVDTRRLCGLRPYVVILVSLHLFTVLADLSTVPADLMYLLTCTFPMALPSVCLLSARYLQLHIRSFSLGLSRFSRPVAHLLVIYCRKRIVRTAHDCIMSAPHNRPSTMILQVFIDSSRIFLQH